MYKHTDKQDTLYMRSHTDNKLAAHAVSLLLLGLGLGLRRCRLLLAETCVLAAQAADLVLEVKVVLHHLLQLHTRGHRTEHHHHHHPSQPGSASG